MRQPLGPITHERQEASERLSLAELEELLLGDIEEERFPSLANEDDTFEYISEEDIEGEDTELLQLLDNLNSFRPIEDTSPVMEEEEITLEELQASLLSDLSFQEIEDRLQDTMQTKKKRKKSSSSNKRKKSSPSKWDSQMSILRRMR